LDPFNEVIRVKVRCGNNTLFWQEVWFGDFKFRDLYLLVYELTRAKYGKVCDFWSFTVGTWGGQVICSPQKHAPGSPLSATRHSVGPRNTHCSYIACSGVHTQNPLEHGILFCVESFRTWLSSNGLFSWTP
jgi:hypothetical protein